MSIELRLGKSVDALVAKVTDRLGRHYANWDEACRDILMYANIPLNAMLPSELPHNILISGY